MTSKDWLTKARAENFAIGAFNIDNLDILKAVCTAAVSRKSPIIVEFSQGEVDYFGLENIVDLVKNAREEYKIPLLLNLDHSKKSEQTLKVIEIGGFDNVHFDGSDLGFEENIEEAKKVVSAAHAKGVLVEGEFNRIAGSSQVHTEEIDLEELSKSYTDPKGAAEFVTKTGVDILAPIFGNVHGTFPIEPDLDMSLLKEIREAVGDTFIAMHGGSGIAADQVKEAINVGGIVKVNVNTELRSAFKDAFSESFEENPKEYAYYNLTPDVILAIAAVVEAKIDVFGSANRL
ncbi:MAG: class II fructose-bisphosphate aldolase [Candidatus Curtissbacteria bacterium]|nr:class II fructose-bisphosphate aldolase [Candidatus Curtissbacteria bacterium]